MDKIRAMNKNFPCTKPIQEWKEKGGKAVAWHCSYIPEEIIHAAGILPVRMTGDSQEIGLEDAIAYLYKDTCTYCLGCFQLVLEHKWDFLDGFFTCNSCEFFHRMASHWEVYIAGSIPVISEVTIPRVTTANAYDYYTANLRKMIQGLEHTFGVKVSAEALRASIRLHNRTRKLVLQLYEMKKQDSPPLTGAETLEVLNAAFCMPREQYNELLEELISEIESTKRAIDCSDKVRLMIYGSPLNNPEFIKCIEDAGAIIVVEDMCTGIRPFMALTEEEAQDPVQSLSQRYLNQVPCPRMNLHERSREHVLSVAKEYRVNGIVFKIIRYCTGYQHHHVLLGPALEKEDYPVLRLDTEYDTGCTGQITTRAQAFVEMIRARLELEA
jgi:benzoyl-CoA reductase/2-hydroxyglutaryl-CoA dehydratase subunit BcrC/BadD/HgdB